MKTITTSTKELLQCDNISLQIINYLFPNKPYFEIDEVFDKIYSTLNALRQDLCVVIETEYVDVDYRDAYYRFYSTKLRDFNRYCVRLSFFEDSVQHYFTDIHTITEQDEIDINSHYLGFIVLRPLKNCLGRNVLSPKALNRCEPMRICGTTVKSSCMGIKLSVWGFPHASQDGQLMTCAETTVWAMSEYFGEKYSHYSRIFPHHILDLLQEDYFERMLPSNGLSYQMISYVLQKQGFACKIYHKSNPMFKELFACYVESGFPIAVAIRGKDSKEEIYGHAVVCIGRKDISSDTIESIAPVNYKGKNLRMWNKVVNEFVANDDNLMPYSIFSFNKEPECGDENDWGEYEIVSFIVPLHSKIYIEAEEAIKISTELVVDRTTVDEPCIRTLLTTARSYREYVIKNPDIKEKEKQVLLNLDFPKFVWITEISSKSDFCKEKVSETLFLDPTADSGDGTDAQIEYIKFDQPIMSFDNLKFI